MRCKLIRLLVGVSMRHLQSLQEAPVKAVVGVTFNLQATTAHRHWKEIGQKTDDPLHGGTFVWSDGAGLQMTSSESRGNMYVDACTNYYSLTSEVLTTNAMAARCHLRKNKERPNGHMLPRMLTNSKDSPLCPRGNRIVIYLPRLWVRDRASWAKNSEQRCLVQEMEMRVMKILSAFGTYWKTQTLCNERPKG